MQLRGTSWHANRPSRGACTVGRLGAPWRTGRTVRWQGRPVRRPYLLGACWPEAVPGGSVSGGPAQQKPPALPSHRLRIRDVGLGRPPSARKVRAHAHAFFCSATMGNLQLQRQFDSCVTEAHQCQGLSSLLLRLVPGQRRVSDRCATPPRAGLGLGPCKHQSEGRWAWHADQRLQPKIYEHAGRGFKGLLCRAQGGRVCMPRGAAALRRSLVAT